MKTSPWTICLGAALLLASGCSTVSSRIDDHRALYESYPLEVRETIAAGQVAVGFDENQVTMALGSPDHVYTRTDLNGTSHVWGYRGRGLRPRISLGVGVGGGGGGTRVGTGVGVGLGEERADRVRVVFDPSGRVTAVEEVR